jgi:hypothetical protein
MSGRQFKGELNSEFNPFQEDYLLEIMEATAVAWNRMKQPSTKELEDQITFRLAGRLANDIHFVDLPMTLFLSTGCWVYMDSGLAVWISGLSIALPNATTLPLNLNGSVSRILAVNSQQSIPPMPVLRA